MLVHAKEWTLLEKLERECAVYHNVYVSLVELYKYKCNDLPKEEMDELNVCLKKYHKKSNEARKRMAFVRDSIGGLNE
jgi:hypothetical protein